MKRSKWLYWSVLIIVILGFLRMNYRLMDYESRIERALELLSGSNDEIVKPARLEAILSGEHFKPYNAPTRTEEDTRADEKRLNEGVKP